MTDTNPTTKYNEKELLAELEALFAKSLSMLFTPDKYLSEQTEEGSGYA
jgi:hypothetical protein